MVDIDHEEAADGVLVNDYLSEPTMGEKLGSLNSDGNLAKNHEELKHSHAAKPPTADSVHALLKQALHADDRALLLDCLYNQDEKVIRKSISLLNPSDVLKLLNCLISITQTSGAILACALPWLRCLLLRHASGIMSQESSLVALNSLYQLIESRTSTFQSALQLPCILDLLSTGTDDDEIDERGMTLPFIYEDKDESDQGSEDAMETDQESEDDAELGGISELEESCGMSC
ncbi:hypothetical protein UlMin_044150 [Ulmus minor]